MYIQIGEFKQDIESFNLAVRREDEQYSTSLNIEIEDNTSIDINEIAEAINNNISFNDIIITKNEKVYTLKNFIFESINRQVDSHYDRITLYFIK